MPKGSNNIAESLAVNTYYGFAEYFKENRLYDDTHNETNEQFKYEPAVANKLHVEECWMGVGCI